MNVEVIEDTEKSITIRLIEHMRFGSAQEADRYFIDRHLAFDKIDHANSIYTFKKLPSFPTGEAVIW